MDFFRSQDHAHRNTKLLLLLFALAVISIILLANLVILGVVNYSNTDRLAQGGFFFSWSLFFGVGLGVLVLVSLGSLFRIHSLSGGGSVVAEMMNGRLLSDPGGDLAKQRLLNVVEEMAIASGTPVPPVYLIPDAGINAFAAGYSAGDAVIGITQGAIENLNRDQLQGVIAHEFSHVLNGDMRLNIRLMGILYGILMLAMIGRIIMHAGRGGSRRDSGAAFVLAGLGLLVVGYTGQFFGNWIKAAVSRQREYLADASAVQFTRSADGISGALKRIGGYGRGTVIDNDHSEEISHAFFCQGVTVMLGSLMATHPPLPDRIRRLDPHWNGVFIAAQPAAGPEPTAGGLASGFAGATSTAPDTTPDINPDQVQHARELIGAIPTVLASAAREPYSARAVVYLILLDSDELVRRRQVDHLTVAADALVYARFAELLPLAAEITPATRLPLLELCMPALRQLSRTQYQVFIDNMDALIRADQKIGLSEWALHKFVTRHLGAAFENRHSRPKHRSLAAVSEHCSVLLSMLAHCDRTSMLDPAAAFAEGRALLAIDLSLLDKQTLSLARLNTAVDVLADLRPLLKPRLLKACVATVAADNRITPVESELVRAIADSLDCPLPPLPVDPG